MEGIPMAATNLKHLFFLRDDVIFLNHGSFGACPRPVMEAYQRWQIELERQPVEFLGRRSDALLLEARTALGAYVNTDPHDLLLLPNATFAMNLIARSIPLEPGDEVLSTNHEYGAITYTWKYYCQQRGAVYREAQISLPVTSREALVEAFWRNVSPRTKVISISHITSPTALIFPVEEICRRARSQGILTVIDGAHAVGQIDLDLEELRPDFYTSNCHKWLCAPKGSAFLYVDREVQARIHPLIISWGWGQADTFVEQNQWQGTRDIAAYLSIPAAIDFQREHHWSERRRACTDLLETARDGIEALTGNAPLTPRDRNWYSQMISAQLPTGTPKDLQQRLYDQYRIEVPVIEFAGGPLLRISVQAYNTADDVEALLRALKQLL
jgi:isopenicillin-N epimerase